MTQRIVPSIVKSYNGTTIRIREDQYVCLTDMATAARKKLNDWCRLKSSESYLETLSAIAGIPVIELLEVGEGNQPTWGHPKISIRFAQWCSDDFAVQVDFWIDELMTNGTVSIAPQPEPEHQRRLAPQRDLIDYIEAAKSIGIDSDPILISLFSQRMAEQLGGNTPPSTTQVIATVRANELGYSAKEIGTGGALGKFLIKQGLHPIGKTQHGKYSVNVYELSEELDQAIRNYFS